MSIEIYGNILRVLIIQMHFSCITPKCPRQKIVKMIIVHNIEALHCTVYSLHPSRAMLFFCIEYCNAHCALRTLRGTAHFSLFTYLQKIPFFNSFNYVSSRFYHERHGYQLAHLLWKLFACVRIVGNFDPSN